MSDHKDVTHFPKLGIAAVIVVEIVILFMYGFFTSYTAGSAVQKL